jgi:hypothetical protein
MGLPFPAEGPFFVFSRHLNFNEALHDYFLGVSRREPDILTLARKRLQAMLLRSFAAI